MVAVTGQGDKRINYSLSQNYTAGAVQLNRYFVTDWLQGYVLAAVCHVPAIFRHTNTIGVRIIHE